MVHAKLLQKEKEIMSINYTATISMNYTTIYYSQLVRRINNLFKQTDVKISVQATNTIQQQLNTAKHRHNDSSRI